MQIDTNKILKIFPTNKSISCCDIAYICNLPLEKVEMEYKKSFKKIQRITELYKIIENFNNKATITIKGNNQTRKIMLFIHRLYKVFPLKYFTPYMKIDPRVILYILCTSDRARFMFKLHKEDIKQLREKVEVTNEY